MRSSTAPGTSARPRRRCASSTLPATAAPRSTSGSSTSLPADRSARQCRSCSGRSTDYPLGIVKLIPFKVHLALDAIGALALGATPFVTGQWKKGTRHWIPHIALCLFELSSLAITDPTGKGDYHGNLEAVREANMEDPHRKIYDGGPAVARAAAA